MPLNLADERHQLLSLLCQEFHPLFAVLHTHNSIPSSHGGSSLPENRIRPFPQPNGADPPCLFSDILRTEGTSITRVWETVHVATLKIGTDMQRMSRVKGNLRATWRTPVPGRP